MPKTKSKAATKAATTSRPKRKFFTKRQGLPLPDLIKIQKKSYQWFLKEGLKELFEEISPITDFSGKSLSLHFEDYYLDEPKFDEITCRQKNITYEAPLRVKVKMVNEGTKKSLKQEIYLGEFPLMTDRGTFIVNGIERVVVSQIVRSAGVFFSSQIFGGRRYYSAKIIPNRGAWLEVETDSRNVMWVKVDRKRKVAVTSLLRAFGYSTDREIKELFKDVDNHPDISYIDSTLEKDVADNQDEGLVEVYKRIRPGDLAAPENAKSLIFSMFFRFDRYDFGRVGRYKINQRFQLDLPIDREHRILRKEDLVEVIKEIINLNISQGEPDDIDHLGNRRIRAVGELIQNKFRIGLARMERIVKDRMTTMDIGTLTPSKLVNARPVIGAVKEFFMSSQLSQFMDQTNPVAELEHKRRISAMGPGGLSKERAGFDVRDVHTSHYGRICPIATPEGPNIGLVGHLASYADINEYGFIETPYRKIISEVYTEDGELEGHILRSDAVSGSKTIAKAGTVIDAKLAKQLKKDGPELIQVKPKVSDDVVYINAVEEGRITSTPASTLVDDDGFIVEERVPVRRGGEPTTDYAYNVGYMDVASNQIVSVATSLIPFVEHDDGQRALMGTNMQRQAVPCIKPDAPIVGTGIEATAARDSGHVIIAERPGEVMEIDGSHIKVVEDNGNIRDYPLRKFLRSNASTCINQRPIVKIGEAVKKGQVLADGPSTDQGEVALGQNVLVGFLAWEGYNFEDAIIISERIVRDDVYSSIHIENYTIDVRDTKLGPEMITADIPNISEEKLKNLDQDGIIRIGAEVKSGDILVGKITPKGETELSAEEKLIRAIFGEKARDVRDTSLYLEHGEHGKVVDVRIFSQENGDKLSPGVIKSIQVSVADLRKIQVGDKLAGRHGNKGVIARIVPMEDMPHLEDGTPLDVLMTPLGVVSRMNLGQILETHLGLAAQKLGYTAATPVLNGITEEQIKEELKKAGYPTNGKVDVYDGKTGKPYDEKVTVGYKYVLKLSHMVEDKMHQRSIGPYSLITQQPLGGKAQFGGQRFGEMEVWALEAYGAAHTLQEILTIKSDDVLGRSKAYESIIKGERIHKQNVPESFNVLVREIKGLCIDMELLSRESLGDEDSGEDVKAEKKKPRKAKKEDTEAKEADGEEDLTL